MGTRSLIAVKIDGQYKVSQYSQFDGYIKGQGVIVLNFLNELKTEEAWEEFKSKVRAAKFLTPDEIKSRWVECGAKPDDDWVSMEVSSRFSNKYPELSRNTGAGVLTLVLNRAPGIELKNEIEFAGDGLFCEFAYVIDFDLNTFEVFTGFHKGKPSEEERFSYLKRAHEEYSPVKLLIKFDLDDLPSQEEFLEKCDQLTKTEE